MTPRPDPAPAYLRRYRARIDQAVLNTLSVLADTAADTADEPDFSITADPDGLRSAAEIACQDHQLPDRDSEVVYRAAAARLALLLGHRPRHDHDPVIDTALDDWSHCPPTVRIRLLNLATHRLP